MPTRRYYHKQILRLDFSKLGDAFTDSVKTTLTALLNEVFVTLFADNQPYISAVTPGECGIPLTYSMTCSDTVAPASKSIFIIEDGQLDLGLLIAVERNLNRILQIIADYLAWNDEQVERSLRPPEPVAPYEGTDTPSEKLSLWQRIVRWFRGLFAKKKRGDAEEGPTAEESEPAAPAAEADAAAAGEAEQTPEEPDDTAAAEPETEERTDAEAEDGPEPPPEGKAGQFAAPEEGPAATETEVSKEDG